MISTQDAACRLESRRRAPCPRRKRCDAVGHARRIRGPPQPRGACGADPRRRVSREPHASGTVEPLGRARQAEICLLGEVVRGRERWVRVRAGDGNRQPAVCGDERRTRAPAVALRAREGASVLLDSPSPLLRRRWATLFCGELVPRSFVPGRELCAMSQFYLFVTRQALDPADCDRPVQRTSRRYGQAREWNQLRHSIKCPLSNQFCSGPCLGF